MSNTTQVLGNLNIQNIENNLKLVNLRAYAKNQLNLMRKSMGLQWYTNNVLNRDLNFVTRPMTNTGRVPNRSQVNRRIFNIQRAFNGYPRVSKNDLLKKKKSILKNGPLKTILKKGRRR